MPLSSTPAPASLRRISAALLVVAWYGGIYAFSSQSDLRVASDDLVDFVLRKAAHMFVFGVLALLCTMFVATIAESPRTRVTLGWSLTLLLAISDEWHQTFVHGRVGHASDVAIDMAGATIALALVAVLRHRRRRRPTPARHQTTSASEHPA